MEILNSGKQNHADKRRRLEDIQAAFFAVFGEFAQRGQIFRDVYEDIRNLFRNILQFLPVEFGIIDKSTKKAEKPVARF
ncbi:MAG: hypothetical protein ACI4OJ_00080 [Lachnospiraceae bacterium]